jgi:DNA repair protein RecO (recombination protein O)
MELCAAFILHARAFKETSLLLDVLTKDNGRVSVIANGARKNIHKFGSSLQPFYFNTFKLSGKTELQTLSSLEPLAYYDLAANNICGLYLNELVYKVLPKHDPCSQLFESYHTTIKELVNNRQPERILRLFEKQLFNTIGFGLDFKNIIADKFYFYKLNYGFVEVMPGTHNCISGISLLSFNNQLDDSFYAGYSELILYELKKLMRIIIKNHLGKSRLCSKEVLI